MLVYCKNQHLKARRHRNPMYYSLENTAHETRLPVPITELMSQKRHKLQGRE